MVHSKHKGEIEEILSKGKIFPSKALEGFFNKKTSRFLTIFPDFIST